MLPMTSPNDPVFFLHHCFVDKLWADWQAMNPAETYQPMAGGPAGHNWNDNMEATVGGQVTPASVWDIQTLGYSYDVGPSAAGGGPPVPPTPAPPTPTPTPPAPPTPTPAPAPTPGTPPTSSSRCFIATAACGSQFAPAVCELRAFRDTAMRLRQFRGLAAPMFRAYEKVSPPLAGVIDRHIALKVAAKYMVVLPAAGVAAFVNAVARRL